MKQSIVTSVALLSASALAQSIGNAVVVNQCPYDVYLFNTPATGGGYVAQNAIVSSGGTWTQQWTQLTNGNGWAIKLSKSTDLSSILQYEYTFHNDGSIWYDLSAVNGDPWAGDWTMTADGFNCTPKYAAYQYSTDDAHAMQWCEQAASISAILCPSEAEPTTVSTISATPSSTTPIVSLSVPPLSVPSVTLAIPTTSEAATSTPATSTPSSSPYDFGFGHHTQAQAAAYEEASSTTASSPTTFATSSTVPVEEAPGVTVWEVETAIVTSVVTALYTDAPPSRIKRHEHHGANHQHAI